ncbi:MAG: hypothetical protein FJ290_17705 [Planctomycetes bacterium]|nr:hypothetical protein [Planctomycetota bacterium]
MLRAFTLVELLAYIFVVGVLMTIAMATNIHMVKHSFGVFGNAEDIRRAIDAGERWRAEVRRANAPLRLVGDILHVPTPEGEVLFYFEDDTVLRKTAKDAAWSPFLLRVKASRMELDQSRGVGSWRWEVELEGRSGARLKPLFTFRAVPPKSAGG